MTTVVEILNRAARQCSVGAPSSWITATDATALELKDFLDQTREDLQDRLELVQPMSKTATITGTGAEEYDLPSDFLRLHRDRIAVFETSRSQRACVPITSDGQWEYLDTIGVTGAYRFYRLMGYDGAWSIGFKSDLETDGTVQVSYVSTVWLVNSGTEKSTFTDAGDACLFPRRLVEAGIVWRFRQRKGLVYEDVRADYEVQLARYGNDSRTRREINFGGAKPLRSPWDIPVPDYIPPT